RIVDGRIGTWALGNGREQGRFLQSQLFGVLVEVELGTGFEAVSAMSQKNLVTIQSEDLLLGEAALDLQRQHDFLDFAAVVAIGREKQVARELHGQSGGALRPAAGD